MTLADAIKTLEVRAKPPRDAHTSRVVGKVALPPVWGRRGGFVVLVYKGL
jgi:hypothetical protein